jgi:hypothetical protein
MSKDMNQLVEELVAKGKDMAKDTAASPSPEGLPYVIVRTQSAGVFAGYLKSRVGKEGAVVQARRLWFWAGAASLSQLAQEGTSKPGDCKFPVPVDSIELTEIIEVLSVTAKAQKSIASVKVWAA